MVKSNILVVYNSKFCIFSFKIKHIYFIRTKPYSFEQTLLSVISMWHVQCGIYLSTFSFPILPFFIHLISPLSLSLSLSPLPPYLLFL